MQKSLQKSLCVLESAVYDSSKSFTESDWVATNGQTRKSYRRIFIFNHQE